MEKYDSPIKLRCGTCGNEANTLLLTNGNNPDSMIACPNPDCGAHLALFSELKAEAMKMVTQMDALKKSLKKSGFKTK